MLFRKKNMTADYMPSKQIKKYLEAKLKQVLGYEYSVTVRLHLYQKWLDIRIDETVMTDEMYEVLTTYMEKHELLNHTDVFEQALREQYGQQYSFEFVVVDMQGAYVIRER